MSNQVLKTQVSNTTALSSNFPQLFLNKMVETNLIPHLNCNLKMFLITMLNSML